jgi:hypothetical protein
MLTPWRSGRKKRERETDRQTDREKGRCWGPNIHLNGISPMTLLQDPSSLKVPPPLNSTVSWAPSHKHTSHGDIQNPNYNTVHHLLCHKLHTSLPGLQFPHLYKKKWNQRVWQPHFTVLPNLLFMGWWQADDQGSTSQTLHLEGVSKPFGPGAWTSWCKWQWLHWCCLVSTDSSQTSASRPLQTSEGVRLYSACEPRAMHVTLQQVKWMLQVNSCHVYKSLTLHNPYFYVASYWFQIS